METQPQIDIEQAQEVDEGKPRNWGLGCCALLVVLFINLLVLFALYFIVDAFYKTSETTYSVPKLTTQDVEDFKRLCAYASQQFAKCAEELWCKKCLALIEN